MRVGSFFAGTFVILGACIAFLSGLCSLMAIIPNLSEGMNSSFFWMVFFIGGIPFAVGVGMFFLGVMIERRSIKLHNNGANGSLRQPNR